MGMQNSRLLDLYEQMFIDLYDELNFLFQTQLPADQLSRERERDLRYVRKRVAAEGFEFLTVQMPRLGKWFDQKLGGKSPNPCPGFHPYEEGNPRFMRNLWKVAFGIEADQLTARCIIIRMIRTVLFAFYKLEIPFTREQEAERLATFLETEADLKDPLSPDNKYIEYARFVVDEVLRNFSIRDSLGLVVSDFYPRHGPGAVASGERQERKWVFSHHFQSLHQRFPYYDFMYGIRSGQHSEMLLDRVGRYRSMVREVSPCAKIVLVPKDSRGPRIISSEPLEVQFIQQGFARKLIHFLEKKSSVAGQINFTDQSVNANLALTSSKDQVYATLDLKDASDRVSTALIRAIFPLELTKDLLACRSTHTQLPQWYADRENIPARVELRKYAPMGSSLCFPIESITFFALSVAALLVKGWAWDRALKSVFVYGDDMIVPTDEAQSITDSLSSCSLIVNSDKSYWNGNFRESCGCDAYFGNDITPLKFKKLPPVNARDGEAAVAWAAYCSTLWKQNFHSASDFVLSELTKIFGFVPEVKGPQSYLSVTRSVMTPYSEYPGIRYSRARSNLVCRLWALRAPKRALELDSWERLNRNLLYPGLEDPVKVVVPNATLISRRNCIVQFYV